MSSHGAGLSRAATAWPAALVLLLLCGAAQAQPRASVPPGCGSDAELREGLRRLIGDAADTLAARVEIGASDDDGLFTLELSLPQETRTLRDADCRTLFRSAIVVAAASLRPAQAAAETQPNRSKSSAASGAPAAAASAADSAHSSAPPPLPPGWHPSIALAGGASLGLLPAPAPRFELSGDLEREAWGAVLALHYMPRVETRASSGRGVGVYAFGGRALGLLVPVRFMRLGAGVEVAFQHGSGLGSALPLSDDAWQLAGVAEIAAVPLRLGHARLELALAAQWNMLRPRFDILGYGEVYRVAIVGGSGLIRLGWTFF